MNVSNTKTLIPNITANSTASEGINAASANTETSSFASFMKKDGGVQSEQNSVIPQNSVNSEKVSTDNTTQGLPSEAELVEIVVPVVVPNVITDYEDVVSETITESESALEIPPEDVESEIGVVYSEEITDGKEKGKKEEEEAELNFKVPVLTADILVNLVPNGDDQTVAEIVEDSQPLPIIEKTSVLENVYVDYNVNANENTPKAEITAEQPILSAEAFNVLNESNALIPSYEQHGTVGTEEGSQSQVLQDAQTVQPVEVDEQLPLMNGKISENILGEISEQNTGEVYEKTEQAVNETVVEVVKPTKDDERVTTLPDANGKQSEVKQVENSIGLTDTDVQSGTKHENTANVENTQNIVNIAANLEQVAVDTAVKAGEPMQTIQIQQGKPVMLSLNKDNNSVNAENEVDLSQLKEELGLFKAVVHTDFDKDLDFDAFNTHKDVKTTNVTKADIADTVVADGTKGENTADVTNVKNTVRNGDSSVAVNEVSGEQLATVIEPQETIVHFSNTVIENLEKVIRSMRAYGISNTEGVSIEDLNGADLKPDVPLGKPEKTEFEMTLNPEHLGKVTVKLVTDGAKMSVLITAATEQARELLQSRATSVRVLIAANGITVEKYEVVSAVDGKQTQPHVVAAESAQTREENYDDNRQRGNGGYHNSQDGNNEQNEQGEDVKVSFAEVVQMMDNMMI